MSPRQNGETAEGVAHTVDGDRPRRAEQFLPRRESSIEDVGRAGVAQLGGDRCPLAHVAQPCWAVKHLEIAVDRLTHQRAGHVAIAGDRFGTGERRPGAGQIRQSIQRRAKDGQRLGESALVPPDDAEHLVVSLLGVPGMPLELEEFGCLLLGKFEFAAHDGDATPGQQDHRPHQGLLELHRDLCGSVEIVVESIREAALQECGGQYRDDIDPADRVVRAVREFDGLPEQIDPLLGGLRHPCRGAGTEDGLEQGAGVASAAGDRYGLVGEGKSAVMIRMPGQLTGQRCEQLSPLRITRSHRQCRLTDGHLLGGDLPELLKPPGWPSIAASTSRSFSPSR